MSELRNTANRVRVALNLGIEMFDSILEALEVAKAKSIYLMEEVEKDLVKLEKLDEKIAAELESPNSALSKADVLEFVEGQRAKGMIIRQYNLVKKLGQTLGIQPNLEIIQNTAFAMNFNLDSSPILYGNLQRS
ncbi:MAG: hypothetical protein M3N42_06435 [Cyanobacteriota bacterium]|nr:hypothetical protein [Cyanobacteriota bacterium]